MILYFSATTCGFYPLDMKSNYIDAGSWPDDAVEMTDKEKEIYWTRQAPAGKQLGGDKKGRPAWVDAPPPTKELSILFAEQKKSSLMAESTVSIDPLNDAVDLGMATSEEELRLREWRKYRVLLSRVDTSTAPDIIWPVKP